MKSDSEALESIPADIDNLLKQLDDDSPGGGSVPQRLLINPVLSEIRRQLQASPFAAIRKLRCDFHEGVAILRGRVPTFHTRQVAQELVRKTAGVEQLDDRITVDGRG